MNLKILDSNLQPSNRLSYQGSFCVSSKIKGRRTEMKISKWSHLDLPITSLTLDRLSYRGSSPKLKCTYQRVRIECGLLLSGYDHGDVTAAVFQHLHGKIVVRSNQVILLYLHSTLTLHTTVNHLPEKKSSTFLKILQTHKIPSLSLSCFVSLCLSLLAFLPFNL